MPFSHHSHSGEFCAHAKDKLETMVQTAIRKNMQVFALTEHMPRDQEQDLYPEEVSLECIGLHDQSDWTCSNGVSQVQAGITVQDLSTRFDAFYAEARRLQDKYCEEITILVGMETEWIRPSSKAQIENILSTYELDILVGSVHHVYGIPIDFNAETYLQALDMAAQNARSLNAETEELLFADYFDAQLEMLEALKPPVVGHFDLIRLCSRRPNGSLKEYSRVWRKIMRNLLFIAEYGGLLEINSSALRKGLGHPYPALEICKVRRNETTQSHRCCLTFLPLFPLLRSWSRSKEKRKTSSR